MTTGNCPEPIETSLSDRAILLHILTHVEKLDAELEEFRPLLTMLRGNGMLPVSVRGIRKTRRGT